MNGDYDTRDRAAQLVGKARNKLMMDFVFEGALLQKLQVVEDRRHASIYTDARVIGYNAEWVNGQSFDDLCFWLLSCVAHCELGHPWRRGARDPALWDEAADHVAHLCLLRDQRVKLPAGAVADPEFINWSTFEVYDELVRRQPPPPPAPPESSGGAPQKDEGDDQPQEQEGGGSDEGKQDEQSGEGDEDDAGDSPPDQQADPGDSDADGGAPQEPEAGDEPGESSDPDDGEGEGSGDGADEGAGKLDASGRPGECLAAGASGLNCDEDHPEQSEASEASKQKELEEWAEASMVALLSCGDEESWLFRRASQDRNQTRSFDEYLDRFVNTKLKDEASWSVANRRYVAMGLYLPGYRSDNTAAMVIGIDVSGSINQEALDLMQAATQRVQRDFRIQKTIVIYCDTIVQLVEEFSEYEPVTFAEKIPGGGGTKFAPVFEKCEELRAEGQEIAGVVYLTDMFGKVAHPERFASSIETLWVSAIPMPIKALFETYPDYRPKFGEVCSLFH